MSSNTSSKQNIEPLTLQTSNCSKIHDEQEKKIIILFEYKMLQVYGSLLGIYAIPNLQNFKIWNCIIFVRKGYYKNGKFKFNVTFSANFPQRPPSISFRSQLYHCLVRESDGAVDIGELLEEEWNYENENMVYSLFSNLQKMFTCKNKMQNKHSYNPEAAKMFGLQPHTFIQRSLQSVELSKDNLYQNEPGSSMIINKYEKGELDGYKKYLQQLCQQNRAPEDKKQQFLNYIIADHQ